MDMEHLKEAQDYFDGRYVLKEDCNETQKEVSGRITETEKTISVMSADLGGIKKILWAIASTCIGVLVTAIVNLVIK